MTAHQIYPQAAQSAALDSINCHLAARNALWSIRRFTINSRKQSDNEHKKEEKIYPKD
jgi:hypothetical protein